MSVKVVQTKGLYKGYSSFEFQRIKQFRVDDIELVKYDLLNHIFTRKGERLMMPTFGTSIPDLVFEPFTDELIELVIDELKTVFDFDPRVRLLQLETEPNYDEHSLVVNVRLYYVELDVVDNMDLNLTFENY